MGQDRNYGFRTLRLVPYTGRTPHVPFKVKLGPLEDPPTCTVRLSIDEIALDIAP